MSHVPSWRDLWRRLVALWKLRRVEQRLCTSCFVPLLGSEGWNENGGYLLCDDCIKVREQQQQQQPLSHSSIYNSYYAPGLMTMFQHEKQKDWPLLSKLLNDRKAQKPS